MEPCAMELRILRARMLGKRREQQDGGFFVRFYLRRNSNRRVGLADDALDIRDAVDCCSSEEALWYQSFWLQCSHSGEALEASLQNQRLVFELRARQGKKPSTGFFRSKKSDLIAKTEISLLDLLASPDGWFGLDSSKELNDRKAGFELQLLLRKKASAPDGKMREDGKKYGISTDLRKRIENLERVNCGCGGKFCSMVHHQEALFAAM